MTPVRRSLYSDELKIIYSLSNEIDAIAFEHHDDSQISSIVELHNETQSSHHEYIIDTDLEPACLSFFMIRLKY